MISQTVLNELARLDPQQRLEMASQLVASVVATDMTLTTRDAVEAVEDGIVELVQQPGSIYTRLV